VWNAHVRLRTAKRVCQTIAYGAGNSRELVSMIAVTCEITFCFYFPGEVARTLSPVPIYDWNCLLKSLLQATSNEVEDIETAPPSNCPQRCFEHADCHACLSSTGGEGGSQECVWSVELHEVWELSLALSSSLHFVLVAVHASCVSTPALLLWRVRHSALWRIRPVLASMHCP
jgi:hypothetical protein